MKDKPHRPAALLTDLGIHAKRSDKLAYASVIILIVRFYSPPEHQFMPPHTANDLRIASLMFQVWDSATTFSWLLFSHYVYKL